MGEGVSLLQGTEKHLGSLEHWWDHGKENRKERLQHLKYEDRRDRRGKCRNSNPESPAGQDPVLGALPVSLFRLAFLEIYHLHALRSEIKQCKAGVQPEWRVDPTDEKLKGDGGRGGGGAAPLGGHRGCWGVSPSQQPRHGAGPRLGP